MTCAHCARGDIPDDRGLHATADGHGLVSCRDFDPGRRVLEAAGAAHGEINRMRSVFRVHDMLIGLLKAENATLRAELALIKSRCATAQTDSPEPCENAPTVPPESG